MKFARGKQIDFRRFLLTRYDDKMKKLTNLRIQQKTKTIIVQKIN